MRVVFMVISVQRPWTDFAPYRPTLVKEHTQSNKVTKLLTTNCGANWSPCWEIVLLTAHLRSCVLRKDAKKGEFSPPWNSRRSGNALVFRWIVRKMNVTKTVKGRTNQPLYFCSRNLFRSLSAGRVLPSFTRPFSLTHHHTHRLLIWALWAWM